MSDIVVVAIIALFTATTSSLLLLGYFQQRALMQDRATNRERAEETAADFAEVSRLLSASNQTAAEQAANLGHQTTDALDQIHILVDLNLSTALRGELQATRALLASMHEVAELKAQRGLPEDPDVAAVMAHAQMRITALSTDLEQKGIATDNPRIAKAAAAEND